LITAAIVLTGASGAAAQTWHLPIRFGSSHAGVDAGDELGSEYVDRFMTSIGAELRLDDDIGIQFDVVYAQKGAKGTFTTPDLPSVPTATFVGEADLDYIEFWATFTARLEVAEKAALKGCLGVSLGSLIKAEATGTANGFPVEVDLEDFLSSVDWSGVAGVGFTYDLKSVTLFIDAIADIGFADINDLGVGDSVHTRAYYTTVGVAIPLTR
jgi:hypothetical protein